MKSETISVCLVVKNEEKYLNRCLSSVQNVADEIIVVDTGSTDKSLEIARQYTDKVFEIRWRDDFSKARNFALEKATCDWILILDGDEELEQHCSAKLKEKINNSDSEGYLIKILNYYDSGNAVEASTDVVFRLFRNNKAYRYAGTIHEQICDNIMAVNPAARISFAEDICIVHYGYLTEEITAKNKAERNSRLLEKAVNKNPENLLNRFHLGVEYFRASRIDRALGEFLFVLEKVDLQAVYAPKLMRYVAQCQYLLGNLEDCLNFINNVWAKHFRDQGDLYFLKAIVCRDLGRHAEAYMALKKCLSVPPQPAHYANLYCQYKDKVYNQLGEVSEYFADQDTALEHYINALKQNPRSVHSLGKIIAILNPRANPEYTISALNKVFDLSDPGIQLDLGHIFFREGAYRLALNFFDSALAKQPVPISVHLVKGLCLMRMSRFKEAVTVLKLIPRDNQFYTTAQGNMFLCYWLDNDSKNMSTCLRNLKTKGKNPALAEVLEILCKKRIITSDELKNDEKLVKQELNEIFERLIELGEFDRFNQAWDCSESLFAQRPAKRLGDICFKYGFFERAEKEYLISLQQNSTDAETLYRLGKTYWAMEKLTEAEKYLCQAVEKGYNTPRVNKELARLYQDLAVNTLEKGLGVNPENAQLSDLLKKIKENLIEV